MLKIITLLVFLCLSACMVGPDFKEPKVDITSHWLHTQAKVKELPIKDADWWDSFHDPKLTALIHQGYENNLSLQIIGVRVLQARAELARSVGQLYPQQQGLSGNYSYQRIGGGMLEGLLPTSFYTASLGFSSTWEIDFWGKYRRTIQSSNASFYASIAAYDNALITLTADVASTYVNIRTTQAQIKVTQNNIKIQTNSLAIANSRYKAGETSLLDVQQAQTELADTEAKLPSLVANLQKQKDLLAVLLGTTPNEIEPLLIGSYGIPKAPATVAVGIPKDALRQRPDIHQAMLEAIAQSAKIGAIKANLYPAFSLSGTFAFASNSIGSNEVANLFQWSNRVITAGPSVAMPLFNYGQITNAVREQDAVFQQAILNYQNLVLKAQQEVQDNITNFIEAQKAEYSLNKANVAAIKTVKLAITRYKEGEDNYQTVLDSERQALQIQLSFTRAQGDASQALIALYRALGGGWQIRICNDVVAQHIKAEMAARTNWGNLLDQPHHDVPTNRSEQIRQLYLPTW